MLACVGGNITSYKFNSKPCWRYSPPQLVPPQPAFDLLQKTLRAFQSGLSVECVLLEQAGIGSHVHPLGTLAHSMRNTRHPAQPIAQLTGPVKGLA